MTEDLPIRICHNCQRPIGDALARINGELYCRESACRQAAKRAIESSQ